MDTFHTVKSPHLALHAGAGLPKRPGKQFLNLKVVETWVQCKCSVFAASTVKLRLTKVKNEKKEE